MVVFHHDMLRDRMVFHPESQTMRFLILFPLLALAACQTSGPVNVLHKTGSTAAQRQADMDQCRGQALRKFPPRYGGGFHDDLWGPGPGGCFAGWGSLQCGPRFGYPAYGHFPPGPEVNAAARKREETRCMEEKGYDTITRPICETPEDRKAYTEQTRQQPANRIDCVAPERL